MSGTYTCELTIFASPTVATPEAQAAAIRCVLQGLFSDVSDPRLQKGPRGERQFVFLATERPGERKWHDQIASELRMRASLGVERVFRCGTKGNGKPKPHGAPLNRSTTVTCQCRDCRDHSRMNRSAFARSSQPRCTKCGGGLDIVSTGRTARNVGRTAKR